MFLPVRSTALALSLLVGLGACRRQQPIAAAPAPAAAPPTAPSEATGPAPAPAPAPGADADETRRRADAESAERSARAVLEATVHFAYDQSDLDVEARRLLDEKLALLERHTDIRLRITGHTDERGADEYNLALGQRRAAAARRYLTQRGIDDGRIELASFGEEQPLCTEGAESCWRRNRRAEFGVIGGSFAAARP